MFHGSIIENRLPLCFNPKTTSFAFIIEFEHDGKEPKVYHAMSHMNKINLI